MPAPPGELATEGMAVVNTEVDYRDEEDSILVDPDEEKPAQEDGPARERTNQNQERLDLLTNRLVLQTKLERLEKINEVLSKQNSDLLSLLPQAHTSGTNPPSSSTSNERNDVLDNAQLLAELVTVKRENQALRYTFLGESLLPPLPPPPIKVEPTEDTPDPKPTPTPTFALPNKPEPGILPAPSLPKPQLASTEHIDLKAVLNKVQALFKENEELTGLLVGEMCPTADEGVGSGMEGWVRVIDESKEMITALDDDLELQSKEIVKLLDRVKGLEEELEMVRKDKSRNPSRGRSRSRARSMTRSRSPSRSPSRSRSRRRSPSRSISRDRSSSRSRSRSRDGGRRSVSSRSPSRDRSGGGRARNVGRRSRSRSPIRPRPQGNTRQRSSSPTRPYRDGPPHHHRAQPTQRHPGRSPPRGPRGSDVPPLRGTTTTSGSNWRDAHGIPTDDLDLDPPPTSGSRSERGKPGPRGLAAPGASATAPVRPKSTSTRGQALPGLNIFGSSSRSAGPRELLEGSSSGGRDRGRGAGGGGAGRRSRSRSRSPPTHRDDSGRSGGEEKMRSRSRSGIGRWGDRERASERERALERERDEQRERERESKRLDDRESTRKMTGTTATTTTTTTVNDRLDRPLQASSSSVALGGNRRQRGDGRGFRRGPRR